MVKYLNNFTDLLPFYIYFFPISIKYISYKCYDYIANKIYLDLHLKVKSNSSFFYMGSSKYFFKFTDFFSISNDAR